MNKLTYNLTQLLNELTTFMDVMNGKNGEENVFMTQPFPCNRTKAPTKGRAKLSQKRAKKFKGRKGKKKSITKDQYGHLKTNCPQFLSLKKDRNKKKCKYDLLVLKLFMDVCDTTHWIVDLG